MDRRKFLNTTAMGVGGLAMMTGCSYDAEPYRFFSKEDAECVIALTDQIIPADQSGPGAKYANVVNYIDKQLTRVFKSDQGTYMKGIKAIQSSCKKLHGKSFEALDFDTQTRFLEQMEIDDLPKEYWQDIKASHFFNLVIRHTMQGFYGAPRHGGNRNYISYQVMNLEYPQVVGQNRYRSGHGK